MAHEAVMWALRQRVQPGEKFVLLMLADRADHEGVCWPSHRDLSELTGLSARTVRRACQALEERGLIEVEARRMTNGRSTSNLYQLRLDRGESLAEIASRNPRWQPARTAGAVAPSPGGPVEDAEPPRSACEPAVRNPVDNQPDLSTGGTQCPGEGDMVSPYEGDMVSPLEPHLNLDPVDPPVVEDTRDEKERRPLTRTDASSSSAPPGAQSVGQGGEGASSPRLDAEQRFAAVDARMRARFGKLWRNRIRGARREVWLETLAGMDDRQIRIAVERSLSQRAPPGAYGFALLGVRTEPGARSAPSSWPPDSRDVGRAALEEARRKVREASDGGNQ